MQQQYRSDEFTSSVSISSHQASANAPADFVIQAMLKDLHTIRKCFSGAALVEWMENYVRDNGYDNLGVCIGSTETETGLELGELITIVSLLPSTTITIKVLLMCKKEETLAEGNIPLLIGGT